jgi:protein-S-isoprenylcysteine O-methyltransferase
MRPLIFHNTTAAILFFSSLILVIAIESALVMPSRVRDDDSRDWSFRLLALALLAGIVSGALAASQHVAPLPGGPWWPVIAGLALVWAGFALRAWSIVTLGHFFQITVLVQDHHRVIDTGPYRLLRHPSYLAMIIIQAGIGVADGDWASIALMMTITTVAFLIRIRVEERALLAALGEDYAAYAQRTARLVPGLY